MVARKIISGFVCVLIYLVVNGCYSCSLEAEAKRERENNATRANAIAKLAKRTSKLKPGCSVKEVNNAFGLKGIYQFSVEKNGTTYSCFGYSVGAQYVWMEADYSNYYSIFENNGLYAIVQSPSFEYETRIDEKGYRISYRKPVVPEKRVETVFAVKRLIGRDLINSFQENFPRRDSCSNLGPIIPLMMILGPVSVVLNSPGYLFHSIEINKLENKYNPQKISIGMSPDEVDSILGKPNRTYHPAVDKIIRVYGSEYSIDGYPQHKFTWFSLEFKNACVISIYSNDFFNDKLMLED